jgi:hypothetical protein
MVAVLVERGVSAVAEGAEGAVVLSEQPQVLVHRVVVEAQVVAWEL